MPGSLPAMAFKLSAEHRAKGQRAEDAFQQWLDWSGMAYLYAEQSPFTFPAALRGRIKRPDFLVGVPHVGALAFDVKAKTVYDGLVIFERQEVEQLGLFARLFNVTLYFVCVDEAAPESHVWVALADLQFRPVERRNRRHVQAMPVAEGYRVELEKPFLDVLFDMAAEAVG
jgi:hypothetical protein